MSDDEPNSGSPGLRIVLGLTALAGLAVAGVLFVPGLLGGSRAPRPDEVPVVPAVAPRPTEAPSVAPSVANAPPFEAPTPAGRARLVVEFYGEAEPPAMLEMTLWPDGRAKDAVTLNLARPVDAAAPTNAASEPGPSETPAPANAPAPEATAKVDRREADLPLAGCYVVTTLRIDGWASTQGLKHLVPDAHGHVVARVRLPSTTSVVVLDAATRAPIANARLVEKTNVAPDTDPTDLALSLLDDPVGPGADPSERSYVRPPAAEADKNAILTSTDGRATLPATLEEKIWWVGASERAWRLVLCGAGHHETRVLLDVPPHVGSIRVTVTPAASAEGAVVSAEPLPKSSKRVPPIFEASKTAGEFVADNVAPGRWKVRVGPPGGVVAWAVATIEVAPEKEATASLAVGPRKAKTRYRPPKHTLSGVVEAAPEWTTRPTRVVVRGTSDETKDVEREVTLDPTSKDLSWEWKVPDLYDGSYDVVVEPHGMSKSVELDESTKPVWIALPRPVEYRLRVVDDATGEPVAYVPRARVVVLPPEAPRPPPVIESPDDPQPVMPLRFPVPPRVKKAEPPLDDSHAVDAAWDAKTEQYVAQAIPGGAVVEVAAPGYVPAQEKVKNEFGTFFSNHLFRLKRSALLVVRVVRGGQPYFGARGAFRVEAERVDETPRDRAMKILSPPVDFLERRDAAPGRYVVSFDPDSGVRPPDRIIDAQPGEETVVDFEATR